MEKRRISKSVATVTGWLEPAGAGFADAHNHLYIRPPLGAAVGVPALEDREAIAAELSDFRQAGGGAIVDCQPGGCGRDGRVLKELAESSGVQVVASTGFHLRRYYPEDYWLFRAPVEAACEHFVRELTEGLEESLEAPPQSGQSAPLSPAPAGERAGAGAEPAPILAGVIKVACQETLEQTPLSLFEAAIQASLETGAAVLVHTERGADAERIADFVRGVGLAADRLILCHLDKRPDFGLHRDLAEEGILLEYDTFYRSRYQPEVNLWPLLARMASAGLDGSVAVAADMADASLWARLGQGPGLVGLFTQIIPRMESLGFGKDTIRKLAGENVLSRLARPA